MINKILLQHIRSNFHPFLYETTSPLEQKHEARFFFFFNIPREFHSFQPLLFHLEPPPACSGAKGGRKHFKKGVTGTLSVSILPWGNIYAGQHQERQNFPADSFGRIFLSSCTSAKLILSFFNFCQCTLIYTKKKKTAKQIQTPQTNKKPNQIVVNPCSGLDTL